MRAGELCIRTVVTAFPDESVVDAARRMADYQVGDLVVVDAPGDGSAHPIGIVTDRDLVVRVLTRTDCVPSQTKVTEVMRKDVVTATEDDDVEHVLASLRRHNVRRMPVVDRRGVLQGIITVDDIVGWMSDQLKLTVGLLERQSGTGIRT